MSLEGHAVSAGRIEIPGDVLIPPTPNHGGATTPTAQCCAERLPYRCRPLCRPLSEGRRCLQANPTPGATRATPPGAVLKCGEW
jgi:hypothetical protein